MIIRGKHCPQIDVEEKSHNEAMVTLTYTPTFIDRILIPFCKSFSFNLEIKHEHPCGECAKEGDEND